MTVLVIVLIMQTKSKVNLRQREDSERMEGAALAGFTAEIITCECRCQTDCKIEFFAQILTRFARPVE